MAQRFGEGWTAGTLMVNVIGSFCLGLIFFLTAPDGRWFLDPAWRQMLMAGFCGGFTTFSAFSFQVLQQLRSGDLASAGIYATGSVLLCVLAVGAGMWAARSIQAAGLA